MKTVCKTKVRHFDHPLPYTQYAVNREIHGNSEECALSSEFPSISVYSTPPPCGGVCCLLLELPLGRVCALVGVSCTTPWAPSSGITGTPASPALITSQPGALPPCCCRSSLLLLPPRELLPEADSRLCSTGICGAAYCCCSCCCCCCCCCCSLCHNGRTWGAISASRRCMSATACAHSRARKEKCQLNRMPCVIMRCWWRGWWNFGSCNACVLT
ncbi:hypothetical protein DUNSADRAFT_552 [Dunaliella salina]|uniref:Encoded protein n=1 Tax=Dunaliella salina TaxID=3046 RepID=A0ABQ7FYT0_DUNSA|nr:hypothetical protein DUNSADRAFT_552 [Dunaliella salina]|eukprot:KAF5827504.1 hypothetical protein DUNSADRAFT_552 [Dunaliella salina]